VIRRRKSGLEPVTNRALVAGNKNQMKTRTFIAARLAAHARTITTTGHLIFRRAWPWTVFLGFATIAFGRQPAQAAVMEAWAQRYGSREIGTDDRAHKVVTDPAGNVLVVGNQNGSEMLVIKYSGAGVSLWTNRYNGLPSALAVDRSGNVFVTGTSDRGDGSDVATIAYTGAGIPLWTNRYNLSGNGFYQATAMAVNASGNVFVTGGSATIAYSGTGVPLWTNYNGPRASALAVDGNGNVVVTGSSSDNRGNEGYATIKYSGAGIPLWTNRYNGSGITTQ
jgi:hypothetical protein